MRSKFVFLTASALYGASPLRRPFRTAWNVAGPGKLCSPGERAALTAFFTAGLTRYAASGAKVLDQLTVRDFAKRWRVSDRTIERILVPLTEGLFFYPPEGAVISGERAAELVVSRLETVR